MANLIRAVQYHSNAGNIYIVGMDSEVFAQVGTGAVRKVGGETYDGTARDAFPQSMRPRQAKLRNPAGLVRYVTCLTSTALLITPGGPASDHELTLEDSDGAATVYTWTGDVLAERQRKRVTAA